ncbi:Uncharacterised protein [Rothia kristinae]|nr:Uncharacterised protein [Rothia kristinae]
MMGKDESKGFSVSKTIRTMFVKRFLARQSGAMLGRALPFGWGPWWAAGPTWRWAGRSSPRPTRPSARPRPCSRTRCSWTESPPSSRTGAMSAAKILRDPPGQDPSPGEIWPKKSDQAGPAAED